MIIPETTIRRKRVGQGAEGSPKGQTVRENPDAGRTKTRGRAAHGNRPGSAKPGAVGSATQRTSPFPPSAGRRRGAAFAACILMAAMLSALLPAPVAAHSPREIVLTYDQPKRTLEVRITHSVSDPGRHFISSVEISRNGQTISRNEYRSQPGGGTVVYTYPMEPFADGVIEVKATCSVSGSATEKLDMRKIPR